MRNKQKIIIIGGGFSGVCAMRRIRQLKIFCDIILIDKKNNFEFLPLLPDIISSRIKEEYLSVNLAELAKKYDAEYFNKEVTNIDFNNNKVILKDLELRYDFLIIASGATNNFYGNKEAQRYALKLYSASDGALIRETIKEGNYDNFVIIGGGYTGIEIATNIWRHFKKTKKEKNIYIVERSNKLLSNLSDNLSRYVAENLNRLKIIVLYNAQVKSMGDGFVSFTDGFNLERALIVWAAGVKTADYIDILKQEKAPQGRLKVNEYLQISHNCFAVGDSANYEFKGRPLRMAIQFSIYEGICAAENIKNLMQNKPLKKFNPVDLGYIIPMANGRSCGFVFGREIFGVIPSMLHYFMCIYRSWGVRKQIGILSELIKNRIK